MSSRPTQFRMIKKDVISFVKQNGIKTVSCDVFDTLLHRRCEPDAVIYGVGRWLYDEGISQRLKPKQEVRTARDSAYNILAAKNAENGLDYDTSMDKMVPLWITELFEGIDGERLADLAHKTLEKEIEFELSACYANFLSLELLKELKVLGVQIIYVSDMYLGKSVVQRLLDEKGYRELFDHGYVSGDHALLKRTGRLFGYMLEELGLDSRDVLHIGDNHEADYVEAKKVGLNAYFIGDKSLDYKKNANKYDHLMAQRDPSWKGYAIASFANSEPLEIGTHVEAYAKKNFGPIYASFIHRVIERCVEEKVERVYFLSREGFLLGMIYNELLRLVPGSDQIRSAHYLYVSRLTTYVAAMERIGLREIRSISDNVGGALSVKNLFSPLKIDDTVLQSIALRHGIDDITSILPGFYLFWSPFINLINDPDIQAIIDEISMSSREALIGLLEQEEFFDAKRVAIIDVGWGGQIQENLTQAIRHREDRPDILGLYMSTNVNAHTRKTPESWMEWMISDQSHLGWCGSSTFDYVQSFEAIARAPHATVVDYDRSDDKIVPVLKSSTETSRMAEQQDDLILGLMQKGILEYVKSYEKGCQIYAAGAVDTISYARTAIESAIRFPKGKDAQYLLSLKNSSDLGLNDTLAMGQNEIRVKYSYRKVREAIKHSFWAYGTVSLIHGRWLQMLVVLLYSKRAFIKKEASLAPGMIWHAKKSDDREETLPTNSENSMHVEKAYIDQWQDNIRSGSKSQKKVLKRSYDDVLSFSDILVSQITLYILMVWQSLTGSHRYYYDGVSRKKLFFRYFAKRYSHQTILKKILRRVLR